MQRCKVFIFTEIFIIGIKTSGRILRCRTIERLEKNTSQKVINVVISKISTWSNLLYQNNHVWSKLRICTNFWRFYFEMCLLSKRFLIGPFQDNENRGQRYVIKVHVHIVQVSSWFLFCKKFVDFSSFGIQNGEFWEL